MASTDAPTPDRGPQAGPLSRTQVIGDALLAATCTILALVVHLSGVESVAQNSDSDALSVTLTLLAVGPIALRRRYPLAVLLLTLLGVLGLVLTEGAVGLAPIGPLIAFCTAVAVGTRRSSRLAIASAVVAMAATALLRPVDLSAEGAAINTLAFGGALLLGLSTRARRARFTADVVAAEQRAELDRRRAEVAGERAARAATLERLRITRELHDVIGHAMSVIVVQADVAERLLDRQPNAAREAVTEIARTGRRSLAEMRQLLGVLREGDGDGEPSPRRPAPTLDDVEALAARVDGAGLPVAVTVVGVRGRVPAGVDLAAYRVVQEALTNCLKHSGATCAAVDVTYGPSAVEVEVVDDGTADGSPPALDGSAGHGLAGMRERVAIYDGDLSVGPVAGGGFRVHATFALAPAATS